MELLKIYLLGAPHIEIRETFMDVRLRKALALLAYLAVTRQVYTRDALAVFFWPEASQQTGRADLRRTVYEVKKVVGEEMLAVTHESISIHPRANLWIDVDVFQKHATNQNGDVGSREEWFFHLSEAAQVYCGDFMAGFNLADCPEFDEWQFFQREHWQQMALLVFDQLIEAHQEDGDFRKAISYARQRLSFDRLHEPTHRYLMQFYAEVGEKAAALRQYQECERILKTELDTTPQVHTVNLVETIRSRQYRGYSAETAIIPKTRYVNSGSAYIAYQVMGDGPLDIIFVSGFVSHLEHLWKEPTLASFFQRLAEFCRLILFDKRGIGLSDRIGDPPSIDNTIEDIHSVMAAVDSQKIVLFGVSEGGPAILQFAHKYPEHCLGLILYGTMAKGTRSEDYPFSLTRRQYDKWLSYLIGTWGGACGIDYFAPSRKHDQQLKEWWATLLRLSSSPGNMRLVLEALRDIDVRPLLSKIRIPCLILHRKDDAAIRVEAGRYLAEHIPQCHYVELDGQDHWWWIGEVDTIIERIKRFSQNLAIHCSKP